MKIKLLTSALILSSLIVNGYAQTNYDCDIRIRNLQDQLNYANNYNNIYRAEGLKRAIVNARAECGMTDNSDLKLNDDLYRRNLEHDIAEQKKQVFDAEYELKKAKLEQKPRKIEEKQYKLKERQDKLDFYQQELNKLK